MGYSIESPLENQLPERFILSQSFNGYKVLIDSSQIGKIEKKEDGFYDSIPHHREYLSIILKQEGDKIKINHNKSQFFSDIIRDILNPILEKNYLLKNKDIENLKNSGLYSQIIEKTNNHIKERNSWGLHSPNCNKLRELYNHSILNDFLEANKNNSNNSLIWRAIKEIPGSSLEKEVQILKHFSIS